MNQILFTLDRVPVTEWFSETVNFGRQLGELGMMKGVTYYGLGR